MTAVSSMAIPSTRSRRPISGPSRVTRAPRIRTGYWWQPTAVDRPGVADWKSPPLVARRSERISDSNDPNKAPARFWRILVLIGLALALIAAGIIAYLQRPKPGPRLTLVPAQFDQLAGWTEDAVAAAIPAFLKSCAAVVSRSQGAALDGRTKSGDFGSADEWRPLCGAAEKLAAGDDKAAREFFEAAFTPFLAGNNGDSNGLFTGYYEITL